MALKGGVITRRPLCLSPDGQLFFAPCDKDVRIYSALSGEHVGTLVGHTATVTAVAPDPANGGQVYTSSQDGSLMLWDVASRAALRSYPIGQPVEHMAMSASAGMAYLSLAHRLGAGKVLGLTLPAGGPLPSSVRPRGPPRGMVASPSGKFLAAPDKFSLWVWAAGEDGGRRPANFHHVRQYTCCAIDPTDTILAAGDASGRIVIWHNFTAALAAGGASSSGAPPGGGGGGGGDGGGGAACATVHWHAHPVGALAFSPDGSQLLSGGAEGVLVLWQLATNKRSYLPRLGGPLVGIAPCPADPSRYLIAQFFDAGRERHAARLQVSARNPVSLTRGGPPGGAGAPPLEPQVTAAAFSASGDALVTLDVAPGTGTSAGYSQSLKFWDSAPAAAGGAAAPAALRAGAAPPYALNTRADAPHLGPVAGLAFHPAQHVVATASEDGE
ncbi:MAG: WD40-repeat-containing domain protein, partial [Monoraphidium minutum]